MWEVGSDPNQWFHWVSISSLSSLVKTLNWRQILELINQNFMKGSLIYISNNSTKKLTKSEKMLEGAFKTFLDTQSLLLMSNLAWEMSWCYCSWLSQMIKIRDFWAVIKKVMHLDILWQTKISLTFLGEAPRSFSMQWSHSSTQRPIPFQFLKDWSQAQEV